MTPGILLLGLALATPAVAQHQHDGATPAPGSATSMASTAGYGAEERAQGLREGRGMGLAMPAEGNGYPGPRHVLEVADAIGLTPDQRARTQALFDSMQAEAKRLGAQLLSQEAELDAMFRDRRATLPHLEKTAHAIGETEAALKIVHLQNHLAMMQILRPDQVVQYVVLRRAGAGSGRTRPNAEAAERSHEH